jgi:hypothetical protein
MELFEGQILDTVKAPVKERNQIIDAAFYDIDALTAEERTMLSPWADRQGMVIVVSPRKAGRGIRHHKNTLRFLAKEGDAVRAVAVAGVGSSVLGTAALARNVADHYGTDVAGIVTGYGLADVVAEALGGWFFYGAVDRVRYLAQQTAEGALTTLPEAPAAGGSPRRDRLFGPPIDSRFLVPGNSDVGTLYDILYASRNIRLLVGHSKGNLLIGFALHHLVNELGAAPHPYNPDLYRNLTVVTLGAVVDIPARFERVYQFIGQLDLLGMMNSELGNRHVTVPGAGHHLNPDLPFHLSVAKVLQTVALPAPLAREDDEAAPLAPWGERPAAARGESARPVATA